MRRLKMLLMSAVLTGAMLIALSGPAMAHVCCVGDGFHDIDDDVFIGGRFHDIDDGRLLFLVDEDDDDCDLDEAQRVDGVTLLFLDCD